MQANIRGVSERCVCGEAPGTSHAPVKEPDYSYVAASGVQHPAPPPPSNTGYHVGYKETQQPILGPTRTISSSQFPLHKEPVPIYSSTPTPNSQVYIPAPIAEVYIPAPIPAASSGPKFCGQCGEPNSGKKFCGGCGNAFF